MATEYVVLSDVPLTPDNMTPVAREILEGGSGVEYAGGEILQWIDANGLTAATVFPSTVVHDATQARRILATPPASFGMWTEVSVPFQASPHARALVDAFAAAVGGTVSEKR